MMKKILKSPLEKSRIFNVLLDKMDAHDFSSCLLENFYYVFAED
jgi:hypothetical protein